MNDRTITRRPSSGDRSAPSLNVLLVQPTNRSYVVMPSLGLGYIAAVLRREGHRVAIHNGLRDPLNTRQLVAMVLAGSFDVVGFQVFTYDLNVVRGYIDGLRHHAPETLLVAGGPHPSADPEGTLQLLRNLDYVLAGEAEIGMARLMAEIVSPVPDLTKVPGLAYRTADGVVLNRQEVVKDLDTLPMPAWDLLQPELYPEAPHGAFGKNFPTAPIMVSRGCPCQCTFCAGRSISGSHYRVRSVTNVMAELRHLKERGIREFHVEDENFTVNKPMLLAFCEALVRERLDMSWGLPSGVRLDTLDAEMLAAMERSGCYSLAVGIEFGTQRILDLTKKTLTLETIRKKLALIRQFKLKVTGFFLLGVPGETFAEMEETIDFALELPLDRAQFNNFIPLPGSEIWEELKLQRRVENLRWESFFVHGVAFAADDQAAKRLKGLQRKAYLKFYLRPKIIVGLIGEIRSLQHLFHLGRRFMDALKR